MSEFFTTETQRGDRLRVPESEAPVVDGHEAHVGHPRPTRLHLLQAEAQPRQPRRVPAGGQDLRPIDRFEPGLFRSEVVRKCSFCLKLNSVNEMF